MGSTAAAAPGWLPLPYAVAALTLVVVAGIAWRARRNNVTALGVAISTTGACAWAVIDVAVAAMAGGNLPRAAFGTLMSLVLGAVSLSIYGLWVVTEGLRAPGWRPGPATLGTGFALAVAWVLLGLGTPWTDALAPSGAATSPGAWWVCWTPGWGYWTAAAVDFAATAWALARLTRHIRGSSSLLRRQATSVLASGVIAAVPSAAISQVAAGRIPDLSPLVFPLVAVVYLYAVLRQGLFQLVPIARGFVLDRLSDAVVVVDREGRLVDGNLAGQRLVRALLPDAPESLTGLRLGVRLESLGHLPAGGQRRVDLAGRQVVLDVGVDELYDRRGGLLARAYVLRDVSELHREREALAQVNTRLLEQLRIVDDLRSRLAQQALRDEGTGLHNRRFLLPQLEEAIARATADRVPLWVLLLDVDRFKSVNDEHGHAVGDRLLIALGQALSAALRDDEHILARYGGEEFVIVLPGLTEQQVAERAERCRTAVAATTVPAGTESVSRTISVGAAELGTVRRARGDDRADAAVLIQAADEALYAAKSAGRDRVVLSGAQRA